MKVVIIALASSPWFRSSSGNGSGGGGGGKVREICIINAQKCDPVRTMD